MNSVEWQEIYNSTDASLFNFPPPYSDEEISKVFKDKGINVARRTVAKYREMLNIPSSAERKRLMRLNKVINIEK